MSFFLTGCGKIDVKNSKATSVMTQAPHIEACNVFTPNMAKELLGENIVPTVSKTIHSDKFGSTISSCEYNTSVITSKKNVKMTLLIYYVKNIEESERVFRDAKDQSNKLAGIEVESINDIGDEAYWSGGKLNQLNVRNKNGWFIISSDQSHVDQKIMALNIAKRIFSK
ncbi:hypothetical protein IT408_01595 [Candidatus Uhrbacteria bacterium]|nr:hypothetical protein [Candidatus Uhrbacteria bacterium]